MAVTGSYKQECPSCEAMVLIKDPSLVGKKIDCPQCKYRFVVEAPKGAGESEAAPAPAPAKTKPKPQEAVTAKKPSAAPPGQAVKKPKRKPIEAEDDDAIDLEKDKGSNKTVLIGIGLSIFAVLLLGVGAYFAFFSGDKDGKPRGTNLAKGNSTKAATTEPKPLGSGQLEITNLLPADTQVVVNLNVKELMASFLQRVLFETPGAFDRATLERKLGLKLDDVERLLLAGNAKKEGAFVVVRLAKPLDVQAFKTALALQSPSDSPIKDQAYFVTEPSPFADNLKRIFSSMGPPAAPAEPGKPQQLAIRLVDARTLAIAGVEPMKEFLYAGGQPPLRPRPTVPKGSAAPSDRYLTIDPKLKAVLDNTDAAEASLISVGIELTPFLDTLKKQQPNLKAMGGEIEEFATKLLDAQALGVALQIKGKTLLNVGVESKDVNGLLNGARALGRKQLTNPAMDKAGFLLEYDGMNIGQRGPEIPKITLQSRAMGNTAVWMAELPTAGKGDLVAEIENKLQPSIIMLRAATDMAGGQSRIHELAAAIKQLIDKEKEFPRGTLPGQRLPLDRVSWMAALLPYLGQGRVATGILLKQSWKDGKNAALGGVLIPAFLDGGYPPATWDAVVPSVPGAFAATHFVGVAGVGREAADYAAGDPALAKKLGVFGYDRVTKADDVKDGLPNTIVVLQVPPRYPRPWIAGGGATVEGVPEKGSVKPYVCVTHEGKRGTFAIMGNGDVRFIPETISDDAFKALCTISGGETVDLDKETVLIPAPGKAVKKE